MTPNPTKPTAGSSGPVLFCENILAALGIDPDSARVAPGSWVFRAGRTEIRMFLFRRTHLFCSAPINRLPEREAAGPALAWLLSHRFHPYLAGIDENRVFLSCRFHLTDLSGDAGEVRKTILGLPAEAEKYAAHLTRVFGCECPAPPAGLPEANPARSFLPTERHRPPANHPHKSSKKER